MPDSPPALRCAVQDPSLMDAAVVGLTQSASRRRGVRDEEVGLPANRANEMPEHDEK